jgi:hypothetical protein
MEKVERGKKLKQQLDEINSKKIARQKQEKIIKLAKIRFKRALISNSNIVNECLIFKSREDQKNKKSIIFSLVFDTKIVRLVNKEREMKIHKTIYDSHSNVGKLNYKSVSLIFRLSFYEIIHLLLVYSQFKSKRALEKRSVSFFNKNWIENCQIFVIKFFYLTSIEIASNSIPKKTRFENALFDLKQAYLVKIYQEHNDQIHFGSTKSTQIQLKDDNAQFEFVLPSIEFYETTKRTISSQNSTNLYSQFFDSTQAFSYVAPTQQFSVESSDMNRNEIMLSQSFELISNQVDAISLTFMIENDQKSISIEEKSNQSQSNQSISNTHVNQILTFDEDIKENDITERHFIDFVPVYQDDFHKRFKKILLNQNNQMVFTQCGTLIDAIPVQPSLKKLKSESGNPSRLLIESKALSVKETNSSSNILQSESLKRKRSSIKVGLSKNQKIKKHLHQVL